jgi:hypothetical protein
MKALSFFISTLICLTFISNVSAQKTSSDARKATTTNVVNPEVQKNNTRNTTKKHEVKSGDTKPSGVKPTDVKPSDVKPSDVKPSDVKPSDVKPSDVKPMDVMPSDVKPSDVKPMDVMPSDVKPTDVKPMDITPADTKPTDDKNCLNVTGNQIELLEKACDEYKFATTKGARIEPQLQERVNKIISVEAMNETNFCKIFDRAQNGEKFCGLELEAIKQLASIYGM